MPPKVGGGDHMLVLYAVSAVLVDGCAKGATRGKLLLAVISATTILVDAVVEVDVLLEQSLGTTKIRGHSWAAKDLVRAKSTSGLNVVSEQSDCLLRGTRIGQPKETFRGCCFRPDEPRRQTVVRKED